MVHLPPSSRWFPIPRLALALGLAALTAGLPGSARAWGSEGHQIIGAMADSLLAGTRAGKEVRRILPGSSLQAMAVWADCVKGVAAEAPAAPAGAGKPASGRVAAPECRGFVDDPAELARMNDYVARNLRQCQTLGAGHGEAPAEPCHRQYHYTDVASVHDHYDAAYQGARDQDVVHAIEAATDALLGHPVRAPFDFHDEREALSLLTHFVGDIHQPLHVVSLYLDREGRSVDPDRAPPAAGIARYETRGGNALLLEKGSLHGEWDQVPAAWAPGGADYPRLLALATRYRRAGEALGAEGSEAAQAWATDTLRLGRATAFDGLSFQLRGAYQETGNTWVVVGLTDAYRQNETHLKFHQLARAGARLALLLQTLWPESGGSVALAPPQGSPSPRGYLAAGELQGITAWLPPAPQPKSAAQADDEARFRASRAVLATPRGQQAAEDDVFVPAELIPRFTEAAGRPLDARRLPTLAAILGRIEEDANQMVAPVKRRLKEGGRVRPLVAHPQAPNCLEPRDMAGRRHVDLDQFHLKDTGSYPSTHALMGLAVALVLSEVLPERADALMARGLEFGESRLICGFHYHSDLEGGRLVAATLYARLQANPAYRQDIATLRQELAVAP